MYGTFLKTILIGLSNPYKDKVYGAYLIEPQQEKVEISYYRFDYKFRTFIFEELDKETRKQWICADTLQQIQQQFRFLWKRVEIEILTCQEETLFSE